MKRILNPPPIELEVQDLDGNTKIFKLSKITSKMKKELLETDKLVGDPLADILQVQMRVFFGGKKEDYVNYDMRVLAAVIDHISEEMRNPIKPIQS